MDPQASSPTSQIEENKLDRSKSKKRKAESIDPGNCQLDSNRILQKVKTNLDQFNLTTEQTTIMLNKRMSLLYEQWQNFYALSLSTPVFNTPIKKTTISPNMLQDRFGSGDVTILNTEVCLEVFEAIKDQINSKLEINLTGPVGIGKSYGLLSAVLTLRKEGSVVIYINNPDLWIQLTSAKKYLIYELIYASLPICGYFGKPKQFQLVDEADGLFAWLSLLMQSICLPEIETLLPAFLEELKLAAMRAETKIYIVSDQENTLSRKNSKGERYEDRFPYNLRKEIGDHRIFSASANNENLFSVTESNIISICTRMSEDEFCSLADLSLDKKLTSEESEMLYQLCNGNPLEAQEYLLPYAKNKDKGIVEDFKSFSLKNFRKRVEVIQKRHAKFIQGRDREFIANFNSILALVDASVNIDTSPMRYHIESVMNKQLMVITEDRSFLESLHPAASKVFQTLRKKEGGVIDALYTILYSEDPFTADTVGRLLEFYIIYVLEQEDNWHETLHFKYTVNENQQQELDFRITGYSIKLIEMGEIIPDRVEKNTIFIPESPSYPCVDVLYLDFFGKTLYAMQITVNMENHKSSHGNFEKSYFPQWQQVYGSELKLQFIWIGGGWKPGRLKLGVQSTNHEVTPKSWIINYKQFPQRHFPLFQHLHEDEGVKNMLLAVKIPSIEIFSASQLRKNIGEGKFKEICSSYFQHRFPAIKSLVFIYGFIKPIIDESPKQYKWPEKTGFILFSSPEDMKIFKDDYFMKNIIEETDIEEFNRIKKMAAMHVKGIRMISINES